MVKQEQRMMTDQVKSHEELEKDFNDNKRFTKKDVIKSLFEDESGSFNPNRG